MVNLELISSYSIIGKMIRDLGIREDEGTLIEWIGEGIEAIGVNESSCKVAVAFMIVDSYQCKLPKYCRVINQLVKNNSYNSPQDILTNLYSEETDVASIPVPVDYDGSPLTDYNVVYYKPFFDLVYEHNFGIESWSKINSQFTPIKLVKSTFPHSEENNVIIPTKDEYVIIPEARMIRFNFKQGQVVLSYMRQHIDENGFPMIPDTYNYKQALESYIMYKISKRDFYNHVQGSESRLQFSEDDWIRYRNAAGNEATMPASIDEFENLNSKNLIPRVRYNKLFE